MHIAKLRKKLDLGPMIWNRNGRGMRFLYEIYEQIAHYGESHYNEKYCIASTRLPLIHTSDAMFSRGTSYVADLANGPPVLQFCWTAVMQTR